MKIRKIKKLHYFSGITISVFIGLHLFNHFYSVFGIEKHIELMNSLRLFYRNILVESILLIAVVIQIYSGLKLFFVKRKLAPTFFERLQIWSGLYLSFFLIFHVTAVLGARWFLELDTNFYFGVAGLNTFPFYIFFIPYYGLSILAFFSHVAAIHHSKMKQTLFGITPSQQARFILTFGIIWTMLIFYGLTNHFNGVTIPAEFDVLIGK
ncbi:MAG: hypothetical protein AB8F94_23470 [Saprospiraceae bacterium]